MGNKKGVIHISLYGLLFIVLIIFVGWGFLSGTFAKWAVGVQGTGGTGLQVQPSTTDQQPPAQQIVVAQSTTSPQLDFLCYDELNSGTAVTCSVYYTSATRPLTMDADGLNIDLDPEETIDWCANATGWYGRCGIYKTLYTENPAIRVPLKDYATSPTLQFYSEDDGLLISTTTIEKLEAGDTPNIKTTITGDYRDWIQGGLFVCGIDKTYFDDISVEGFTKTDIPPHWSATQAGTQWDGQKGAWAIGDLESSGLAGSFTFMTTVDTDDTTAVSSLANMTCYLEDQDYFIDEKCERVGDDMIGSSGCFGYGASDENDANVGQGAYLFNITLYAGDS